jgi:hypothetical protein
MPLRLSTFLECYKADTTTSVTSTLQFILSIGRIGDAWLCTSEQRMTDDAQFRVELSQKNNGTGAIVA